MSDIISRLELSHEQYLTQEGQRILGHSIVMRRQYIYIFATETSSLYILLYYTERAASFDETLIYK
jgi:hypothetical protein